jgi:hypothetical protein
LGPKRDYIEEIFSQLFGKYGNIIGMGFSPEKNLIKKIF